MKLTTATTTWLRSTTLLTTDRFDHTAGIFSAVCSLSKANVTTDYTVAAAAATTVITYAFLSIMGHGYCMGMPLLSHATSTALINIKSLSASDAYCPWCSATAPCRFRLSLWSTAVAFYYPLLDTTLRYRKMGNKRRNLNLGSGKPSWTFIVRFWGEFSSPWCNWLFS